MIAQTKKGGGVSFMEPESTCRVPTRRSTTTTSARRRRSEYERAVEEVRARLNERLDAARRGRRSSSSSAEPPGAPARPPPSTGSGSSPPTATTLVEQAEREPRLVALDADLRKDTGLVEFRERFPDRFFECGIAEQDMVSQAGAMALAGLLPVVHSFACFLSTRPNEQIYNNATEGTKVIYAGSLAGLVPGGPGHSHQSVRDISALGAVPGHGADRAVLRARGAARRSTGR